MAKLLEIGMNKIFYFFCVLLVLVSIESSAQNNYSRLRLEWLKQTPNLTVQATDTDSDGNLYVTGFFNGTVSIPTSPTTSLEALGARDIFVMKIDKSGNFHWAFRIGGIDSTDRANAIKVDRTNNRLFVAGQFAGNNVSVAPNVASITISSYSPFNEDAFFAVYDLNKNYNDAGFAIGAKVISGVGFQTIYALEIDNAGNIYVGGFYQIDCTVETLPATTLPNPGTGYEGWLAKYQYNPISSSFTHQWSMRVGAMDSNDNVYSIAVDNANCYVVGYVSNGATIGSFNVAIISPSSSGNAFLAVLNTNDGTVTNFLIIAKTNLGSDALRVVLNSDAIFVAGTFGGNTEFVPSSTTINLTATGGRDVFIAKYAKSPFSLLWVARVGGGSNSSSDELGAIALQDNHLIVACSHLGNATYNRKTSTINSDALTNIPGNDFDGTLLKINAQNGNLLWYHTISGSSIDKIRSLSLFNDNGNWYVYVCGEFQGSVDFNFEPDATNTLQASAGPIFYNKYQFKLPQEVDISTFQTISLPDGRIQLSAQTNVGLPNVKFFSTNTNVAQIDENNLLTIIPTFNDEEALIKAYHLGNSLYLPTDTVVITKVNSYSLINYLQDDLANQLYIVPNPVSDYFWIEKKNDNIWIESTEIFDMFGRKIVFLLQDKQYHIGHISKGMYYLHIRTNKGVTKQKLIKN